MAFLLTLLAAGSLPTLVSAAPLPASLLDRAGDLVAHLFDRRGFGDSYIQYTGSGESNWPSMNDWISFDQMFANSKSIIQGSCTQWQMANPSADEINDIKSGVQTVAGESGVDARFIFAVLMQESNGCVRAPTTNYGVRNPGLMQDHNGDATCNDAQHGGVQNPCPSATITQMIRDGVEGTQYGDGLKQCLGESGASGAAAYYRAARIYNSGSISGNDLSAGVATHCYASDIANRLTGWAHSAHGCNLDGANVAVNTIMPSGGSSTDDTPSAAKAAAPAKAAPAAPAPTTATPAAPLAAPTPPPVSNKQPPSHPAANANSGAFDGKKSTEPAKEAPAPVAPSTSGAQTGSSGGQCTTYVAKPGDNCYDLGTQFRFSFADFRQWNPTIDATCSNLDAGVGYCIKTGCLSTYTAKAGDNCYDLGTKFGFSFDKFRQWNPTIDATCSNLYAGSSYCVGHA